MSFPLPWTLLLRRKTNLSETQKQKTLRRKTNLSEKQKQKTLNFVYCFQNKPGQDQLLDCVSYWILLLKFFNCFKEKYLTGRGGWVVSLVAWQSSNTAILRWPRFNSHWGLQYWSLEIIKSLSWYPAPVCSSVTNF